MAGGKVLKSEIVYRALKRRIIEGSYTSGYRLVVGLLASEFNVSALPVRDAIKWLECEGMVATKRHVGAEVISMYPSAFRDEIATVAYMEGVTAGLSTQKISANTIKEAISVNDTMRQAAEAGDASKLAPLNQKFHELLCGSCPNLHLLNLLEDQWERTRIFFESAYDLVPGISGSSVDEHDVLVSLLRSNPDPLEFELAVREHRMRTLRLFDQAQEKTAPCWL